MHHLHHLFLFLPHLLSFLHAGLHSCNALHPSSSFIYPSSQEQYTMPLGFDNHRYFTVALLSPPSPSLPYSNSPFPTSLVIRKTQGWLLEGAWEIFQALSSMLDSARYFLIKMVLDWPWRWLWWYLNLLHIAWFKSDITWIKLNSSWVKPRYL